MSSANKMHGWNGNSDAGNGEAGGWICFNWNFSPVKAIYIALTLASSEG